MQGVGSVMVVHGAVRHGERAGRAARTCSVMRWFASAACKRRCFSSQSATAKGARRRLRVRFRFRRGRPPPDARAGPLASELPPLACLVTASPFESAAKQCVCGEHEKVMTGRRLHAP